MLMGNNLTRNRHRDVCVAKKSQVTQRREASDAIPLAEDITRLSVAYPEIYIGQLVFNDVNSTTAQRHETAQHWQIAPFFY